MINNSAKKIQIIEFSVKNYKVFRDRMTFSMVARKSDRHTFVANGENLLRTSFIYGPNSSGKTSILEALNIAKRLIRLSANIPENQEHSKLPYQPFLALEKNKSMPVDFDITFSLKGDQSGIYRYSFSILNDSIISEKLVNVLKNGEEKEYFLRKKDEISISYGFDDIKNLLGKIPIQRKEVLFLSTAAQIGNIFALNITQAFDDVIVTSGIFQAAPHFTARKFKENNSFKEKVLGYLRTADFCIVDGYTKEIDMHTLDIGIKNNSAEFSAAKRVEKADVLFLQHPIYKDNKITGRFDLPLELESAGTRKFLSVLGPVIDTLEGGKVLLMDEFDNSLHPLLTKFIVDLFESEEINKNNAQLIVTTHDTSLLSYKEDFIKDQFWFTEKDVTGAAKLFSLGEFKLRNDIEYGRKYLEGRFGALPFVGSVRK